MYQWSRRSSLIALFIAGQAWFAASPVQGGAILDWLFGTGPSANGQVVTYYPPTTTYYAGPAVSSVYTPTTSYYAGSSATGTTAYYAPQPTVAYRTASPTVTYRASSSCMAPAACQGASSACCTPTVVYQAPQNLSCPTPVACQPPPTRGWNCLGSCFSRGATATPVRAARQTYYRTSWKRIPVTSYRPVTSADPITNCPVTVMKPCTTYTWQPERRRCGFFGRLFGRCDPGPAATACPNPCMTTQCAVAPSCCASGVPTMVPSVSAPAPAGQPYYAPTPANALPGASVLPPSNVPTLSPQGMPPAGTAPPAGAPVPADTRPTLVPGASGVGPPPVSSSNWGSGPAAGGDTAGAAAPASANAPVTSGFGPEMAPPQRVASPQAGQSDMVPLPAFGTRAALPENPKLNPVPDPDAIPIQVEEDTTAPQLLENPRDRVASLRAHQAWACTPISWPQKITTLRPATPRTKPRRETLDDSGWHSIAQ